MRIICDQCGYPVSGTVKRTAGNLNLHPECLVQLGRETSHELTAATSRIEVSLASMLLERKGISSSLSQVE